MTIREAARELGHTDPSNLHKAIRQGRLRTIEAGPLRTRVTTHAWLEEYRQSLRSGGYRNTKQDE